MYDQIALYEYFIKDSNLNSNSTRNKIGHTDPTRIRNRKTSKKLSQKGLSECGIVLNCENNILCIGLRRRRVPLAGQLLLPIWARHCWLLSIAYCCFERMQRRKKWLAKKVVKTNAAALLLVRAPQ